MNRFIFISIVYFEDSFVRIFIEFDKKGEKILRFFPYPGNKSRLYVVE
jgi:hypothetical protein